MNMTTKKLNTMIEEIELFNKYYPISNYDEFIINIKNNNIDLLQNNQKLVFDYFYSHISSMGDLISIEEAIKYKVINDINYYKVVDKFTLIIKDVM